MVCDKKALTSVVLIALLLILSIFVFIYLQKWFDMSKNDLEVKINEKNFYLNFEINKIKDSFIYMNNDFQNNLIIDSLTIDGNECLTGPIEVNEGFVMINVSSCSQGLDDFTPYYVTLRTNFGIITRVKLIQNPTP